MIEIQDLSRKWDDFTLDDISLEIQEGEFFVILGPTGAGKTLLLELLAGFFRPDHGRIKVGGNDYTYIPVDQREFGFVYQDYMLFPHMDVRENIGYGLKVRGEEGKEEKVEEVAGMVGVKDLLDRKPSTLSGGEKQRVSITRALVIEPEVMLLDEPFGSVDHRTARELRELIKELHSETGSTMIHVTHDQEEAVVMGDRVAVMKDGEIVQIGRPEDIMRRPGSKFIAQFVGTGNIYHGEAVREKETSLLKLDGMEVITTSTLEGDVTATIRPEDIIIAEEEFSSSARNSFEGTTRKVLDRGNFHEVRVEVNGGVPFLVYVTKQSVDRLSLKEGKEIYLMFKASAVHVFQE